MPVVLNGTACAALIDSGNVWRTAISASLAKRLGCLKDVVPLPQKSVRTADEHGSLEVLGETRKWLNLAVHPADRDEPVIFQLKPVVIQGLGMPLNLSGPFLKRFGIDQLHSKDALRLSDGGLLPLLAVGETIVTPEPARLAVVLAENTVIKPNCLQYVKAKLQGTNQPQPDGMLFGENQLGKHEHLLPWSRALVRPNKQNELIVGICSTAPVALRLPQGTAYGHFAQVCSPEEELSHPWKIAVMQDPMRTVHKPSVRERMQEIIKTLQKEQKAAAKKKEPAKETIPKTVAEKKKWLYDAFQLQSNPILTTPAKKQRLVDLLLRYWDTISVNGEFGHTKLLEHEINTGDAAPIKCRSRPLNPVLAQELEKQIQKQLKQKLITPSTSPWSFPLVAAPKKNGAVRWCVDYRRLNAVTTRDCFPLPSIDDNLAKLSGNHVFSTIDGAGAFHVVDVKKEDRPKTAFSTPFGLYQYTRMPFGLMNGPATYSRLIQIVLRNIPTSMAMAYLDDVIIVSKDEETHFENLTAVLEAHRQAGLKLQPSKCALFRKIVEYMGYKVSGKGVHTREDYCRDVRAWKFPVTRTDMRAFLGKCCYYRRFVKGYSKIAAPLMTVIGFGTPEENDPIEETPERRKAFDQLKLALCSAPVLAHPRFGEGDAPFVLDTDWSQDGNAIGGVLSQEQDGLERVIAFGGKKMSEAQRNYPATKGELAAVLYFIDRWNYYLKYRPFVVRTDHAPLTHLHTMQPQDKHTLRMLGTLANYNFTVLYRPGKNHSNADSLSRAPHITSQPEAEADVAADTEQDAKGILALAEPLMKVLYTAEELRDLQEADEALQPVKKALLTGKRPDDLVVRALHPDARTYFQMWECLRLDGHGIVVLVDPSDLDHHNEAKQKPCLPEEAWDPVIKQVHEKAGHKGVLATMSYLQPWVFFPRMKATVTDILKKCEACIVKANKGKDQRHTLVSVVDGYPFQRISIDYVGPLPPSRGFKYIFTVRDSFTKWIEAFPTPAATAKYAIARLTTEVFKRFGIPEEIHSDQGSHFTADIFKDVTRRLGCRHTLTPPYNPRSNFVERAHKDLAAIVKALQVKTSTPWPDLLPATVMAMNNTVHSSTGYSPFRLLFGRDPQLPLKITHHEANADNGGEMEVAGLSALAEEDVAAKLKAAFGFVRNNLQAAVERRRRQYHHKKQVFPVGSLVYLFSPVQPPGPRKFATYWTGPYRVKRLITEVLVELEWPSTWKPRKKPLVVSVDRLKLLDEAPESVKDFEVPPTDGEGGHDLDCHGDMFVERPDTNEHERKGSSPDERTKASPSAGPHGGFPRGPDSSGEDSEDDDPFGGGGALQLPAPAAVVASPPPSPVPSPPATPAGPGAPPSPPRAGSPHLPPPLPMVVPELPVGVPAPPVQPELPEDEHQPAEVAAPADERPIRPAPTRQLHQPLTPQADGERKQPERKVKKKRVRPLMPPRTPARDSALATARRPGRQPRPRTEPERPAQVTPSRPRDSQRAARASSSRRQLLQSEPEQQKPPEETPLFQYSAPSSPLPEEGDVLLDPLDWNLEERSDSDASRLDEAVLQRYEHDLQQARALQHQARHAADLARRLQQEEEIRQSESRTGAVRRTARRPALRRDPNFEYELDKKKKK